ncbi:carboxylesterase/lipase family protein [Colwellia demingiae]|uniref:Carboxylesterase/lipase family protein n=1 Tax=Colwellia demingiae TaxID=89401 RepID=A0A5C6Q601_9GAMM|nr:carboxylesterase family protein [Colwellia demingiae]TWX64150.1 carboxylesterase/lipase family protein [Colwellia demingiae]
MKKVENYHLNSLSNKKISDEKFNSERFIAIDYSRYAQKNSRWSIQSLAPELGANSKIDNNFGSIAPQLPNNNDLLMSQALIENQSEDCLNLNIYSNKLSEDSPFEGNKPCPVMVWIHGGGFTVGAGSLPIYEGSNLATATNCIVVTLNYRLGALGFLRLKDITKGEVNSTGNEGLEDQLLALQWLHKNIHHYGGDKNNITLFGESAGAMSIACLLAMPKAKGLFHKAIMQSGAGHTFNTVEQANEVAEEFLVSANTLDLVASQLEPEQLAQQLKQLTTTQVLTIQAHLVARPEIYSKFGILPFKPVVGDLDLPLAPYETIKQGCAKHIPILSGSNTDEWTLFAAMLNQNISNEAVLNHWLTSLMGSEHVVSTKTLMSKQCQQRNIPPSLQNVLSETLTEFWFAQPSYRLLHAQLTAGGEAFSYKLGRKTVLPTLRCTHITDLGLVFNNVSSTFHGEEPRVAELVEEIQTHWGHFAHFGTPSRKANEWPMLTDYLTEVMFFDHHETYVKSIAEEEIAFWSIITDKQLASF